MVIQTNRFGLATSQFLRDGKSFGGRLSRENQRFPPCHLGNVYDAVFLVDADAVSDVFGIGTCSKRYWTVAWPLARLPVNMASKIAPQVSNEV